MYIKIPILHNLLLVSVYNPPLVLLGLVSECDIIQQEYISYVRIEFITFCEKFHRYDTYLYDPRLDDKYHLQC